MFERFTDRSRRVVVLAQEEARLLNHNYIGTEHLLLGMIREGEGVAAQVLEAIGVRLDVVRADVQKIIGTGASSVSGHVPFTPRAKKVLELSLREALQLGHNYIGTEHILLGLVREGEGVAAQVLHNRGANLERVRHEVIERLSAGSPRLPGRPPGERPSGSHGATPAATRAEDEARRLAGDRPVGTQHLLSAILRDEASMAARALAALGVTPDTLETQLASLEVTGTSDDLPEEAGARVTSVQLVGNSIAVVFDDDTMAARLAEKLPVEGEARVLRSDHPAAASFPRLWKAFEHILSDVAWRLDRAAEEAWRPPDWETGFEVAAYLVVSGPGGLQSHLSVAEGVDVASVRAGLAAWLTANQPTGREMRSYMSVLVDAPDEPGGWGRVRQMTTGEHGDGPKAPVQLLVGHAIIDLTAAA